MKEGFQQNYNHISLKINKAELGAGKLSRMALTS